MDNTKKKVHMILSLILISLAIVAQILLYPILFSSAGTATRITMLLNTVALLTAFLYVFTEYKKSSAKYFKLFILSYALSLLSLLVDAILTLPHATSFFMAFVIASLIILLGTKDFGKKKSSLTCFAILILELAIAITMLVTSPKLQLLHVLSWLSRLPIPMVLLIIMFLKYSDKQMRGTK